MSSLVCSSLLIHINLLIQIFYIHETLPFTFELLKSILTSSWSALRYEWIAHTSDVSCALSSITTSRLCSCAPHSEIGLWCTYTWNLYFGTWYTFHAPYDGLEKNYVLKNKISLMNITSSLTRKCALKIHDLNTSHF